MQKGLIIAAIVFITVSSLILMTFGMLQLKMDRENPKQVQITFKGLKEHVQWGAWVPIDKVNNIIFGTDGDTRYTPPYRFISGKISAQGNTSPVNVFIDKLKGKIQSCSAVIFENTETTGDKNGAQAAGVVFIAYYESGNTSKVIFAMALFDRDGKLINDFIVLRKLSTKHWFDLPRIFVAQGPDSVGVAFSVYQRSWKSTDYVTFSFLAEVDFDGNVIRGPIPLKIPGRGKNIMGKVGRIEWYGSDVWMIPFVFVEFVKQARSAAEDSLVSQGNTLLNVAAKIKGNKYRQKASEIAADNEVTDKFKYDGTQFLPQSETQADKAKTKFKLFYQRREYLDQKGTDPRDYTATYHAQLVKKSGKAKGRPKEVKFPEWNPKEKLGAKDNASWSDETASRVYAMADGRMIVSVLRSLTILGDSPTQPNDWDHRSEAQICVFPFNSKNYKVTSPLVTKSTDGRNPNFLFFYSEETNDVLLMGDENNNGNGGRESDTECSSDDDDDDDDDDLYDDEDSIKSRQPTNPPAIFYLFVDKNYFNIKK